MIILAAAHFAWAAAQVKPVDGRISKMKLTATELAHYMAPGVNLGNTMEACDWNDVFTNQAGLIPYVWDINVQPLPHMTIFDRKKQVVSDSYIFKGVMQGAAEGMEDYQKIYPKP